MTAGDDEQTSANQRLFAAMRKLGVFYRIDVDGRILAFNGKQEYEVIVDLSRLLTDFWGSRRIRVGKSSLARLEGGDVSALFSGRVTPSTVDPGDAAACECPVSPYYGLLEWDHDYNNFDDDDAIAAEGDDWTCSICPVRGEDDEVIGYQVSGGDFESGYQNFGSSLVDGEPGELTLKKAKAAAQADYASRYLEADKFLDGLLGDWDDDDGPRTRRNELGRIMFRVGEPHIEEVEVVATLRDYLDRYDVDDRCVAVCLRTILSWESDPGIVLDELRQTIRREIQSGRGKQ